MSDASASTLPRLYLAPDRGLLAEGAEVTLTPEQTHYLAGVLRRRVGDAARLFNETGGEWRTAIASLHRRGGMLRLAQRLRPPAPEAGPTLVFALLKRDATDLLIRMATELGVAVLQPVLTTRTNPARVNLERLGAIAIEAAEQSERLSVPRVAAPMRLDRLLDGWEPARPLLAAIERIAPPSAVRPDMAAWGSSVPPGLLTGPEGGFAPAELDALRARPFVTLISLGSRILRAETAAVAGLISLQAAREGWGVGPQAVASTRRPEAVAACGSPGDRARTSCQTPD